MLKPRMPRSKSGKAALVVSVAALGAAGQPVFGGDRLHNNATPDHTVAELQERVDTGQPVPYDANCGVLSTTDGTTVIPLTASVDGRKELFRLTGTGSKLRVVRIAHPEAMTREEWAEDPEVTVVSDHGVINTETVDGTPVVNLELSNGDHIVRAIGQTAATVARDLKNPNC